MMIKGLIRDESGMIKVQDLSEFEQIKAMRKKVIEMQALRDDVEMLKREVKKLRDLLEDKR